MAHSRLTRELPFQHITNFSLANMFLTDKRKIQRILNDSGISKVLEHQLDPIQMETFEKIGCNYYSEDDLNGISNNLKNGITFYHQNIRSLPKHAGSLFSYLECLKIKFDIIALSEIGKKNIPMMRYIFNDYDFFYKTPDTNPRGGVAIFVKSSLGNVHIRTDLELKTNCECDKCQVESLFVELDFDEKYIFGCIYRHPNGNTSHFCDSLRNSISKAQHGPIIVCGDINIDFLKLYHPNVKKYLDTLVELQLIPLVTIPTRITDDTQTLIDHIYIRTTKKMAAKQIKTGVLYSDITDHLPLFLILSKTKIHNTRRLLRIYNDTNIANFKRELSTIDWTPVTNLTDITDAYSKYMSMFVDVFNKNFPLVNQSRSRQNDKKWMTMGLRKSIRHKNILLKIKIKNPTEHNINKFKAYNKILKKCLYTSENQYYLDILDIKNRSNTKFWKLFGSVINPNKQKKQNAISKILCNGTEITGDKDIANAINEYFSTVGAALSSKFPANTNFKQYMKFSSINSLYLSPVTDDEIKKEINGLKANKSSGPDTIPPRIVKYASESITPVLTHIFNLSIQKGIYPDMLKISEVIALYKKGKKILPENYRPISLLDIFDKIFERLLYKRIVVFFNKYNMLFQYQFGFRENHSTVLALIEITDKIKKHIDKNEFTIGIFLDLCKAFDSVDHSILLSKLKYYGVRGLAYSLLSSYLSNRKQYTVINNVKSDTRNIGYGVPQGSVLGPLLFLIFINDIQYCTNDQHLRLFADDTGIFVYGKNLLSTIEMAQSILNKLQEWFKHNKLTISVNKCAWMIFHGKRKKIPENLPSLYMNNVEMIRVNSYKYIGLTLDSTLSWAPHVNSLCTTLNRYFGIFYHIRHKIPKYMVRQLYFSTIFSHINYGLELYGSCASHLIQKLQVKQNSLLKLLLKHERLYSTDKLHSDLDIMKIDDLFKVKILSFVYECLSQSTIPLFHDYFQLHHNVHTHDTRNRLTLSQPLTKTAIGHSALNVYGASLWNNSDIAKDNFYFSKRTFKKKITASYIKVYQEMP